MRFGGLIAAIIFAAIAAVIVLRMSDNNAPSVQPNQGPSTAEVATTNVYVANQEIPIGTTISEDMIVSQPWPDHLMLSGFMKAGSDVTPVGMVARGNFQAQEPLLRSKVANAQDPNFLAGSLPAGMRLITIETNEIQGLAGFIFPGDHIDVLLTYDADSYSVPPTLSGQPRIQEVQKPVTETLLTNVVVAAVDQRSDGDDATDQEGNLRVPESVTLMTSLTGREGKVSESHPLTAAASSSDQTGCSGGRMTLAVRG